MSDSEDEELEASLVLCRQIPELEPLKNRGTRFQQEFACFQFVPLDFLFDFGASQTSP